MYYKVVILAAGKGSRLEKCSEHVNKAVIPVGFKGAISHVIEKFPKEVEFIIVLGHKKEIIKEYLKVAHPDRKFKYINVDNISAPGTGPGYSLLQCKKHLRCPFIISTVDTIVLENIPEPKVNWLGIYPIKDTSRFNSVKLDKGLVYNMKDKEKCDNSHAFIGICGIADYNYFWRALKNDRELIGNELQLSNGLRPLISRKLCGIEFSWFDTGVPETLKKTQEYFSKKFGGFDFSKPDEFLYFVGDRVIKYFRNPEIIKNRVLRAKKMSGFVPEIEAKTNNFYAYKKIPGKVLYEALDDKKAKKFFDLMRKYFWQVKKLSAKEKKEFQKINLTFYRDKTKKRVKKYFARKKNKDDPFEVNGIKVESLSTLFKKVDWHYLSDGIPARFHGDLHFDNSLATDDRKRPFVLLDWRPDFGGLTNYGDLYYDLAKLYGGMIIPYNLIKKNQFSFKKKGKKIDFDIASGYKLQRAKKIYEKFLEQDGFDIKKVKILTALIFLNMSPLHEGPFDELLHHLGKLELQESLAL